MSGKKEMVAFYRALTTLLSAGVNLHNALAHLREPSFGLAEEAEGMRRRLLAGHTLSQAMMDYPKTFPLMVRELVHLGEETGALREVLQRLADHEERARALAARVRSALVYPICVLLVGLLMLVWLPIALGRSLSDSFGALGLHHTLVGQLLSVMGSPYFVVGGLASVLALVWMARPVYKRHAAAIGQGLQAVPGLGRVLRLVIQLRFTRALALCTRVGIYLPHGLRLAAAVGGCPKLRLEAAGAARALTHGIDLSRGLAGSLEPTLRSMLEVGEETGKVPELLESACDLLELELQHSVEVALAMLEPVMLAGVGLMVGLFAMAMLGPLTQLLGSLS
ncbi:MAG: type II secretion system F family protein [Vulcanimicrobiota bacterium]